MTNMEWALACAKRGWLVFPSEGKRPLIRWSTGSTTDTDTIKRLWTLHPDANVCIKTGADSNLVVIDWDAYKDRPDLKIEDFPYFQECPPTYTVVTSKGGYHFYFQHPGYPVANSASTLANYVDVRGDGGMVVAYQQVLFNLPLARIPEALAARRTTSPVNPGVSLEPANPYTPSKHHAWARNIYKLALLEIADAPEGKRNFILYAQASDVYRLVWNGTLDKDTVTQEMGEQAYANGMEPQEIAATLTSAMRNAASQFEKGTT